MEDFRNLLIAACIKNVGSKKEAAMLGRFMLNMFDDIGENEAIEQALTAVQISGLQKHLEVIKDVFDDVEKTINNAFGNAEADSFLQN